jgi:autotransporter-associated beta strand protein
MKVATKLLSLPVLFFACLITPEKGLGANLMLTNSDIAYPGTGGNWTVGANWLTGVAPGPGDVVVLSNSLPPLAATPSYTLPSGYPSSVKGLAPDASWTNIWDGLMPVTSTLGSLTVGGLWVPQTNLFNTWYIGNQLPEGAHNLYISNQLNIVSTVPRDLYHIFSNTVGVGTGFDITQFLVYATVQGPGSLNVTNPNGCMWVGQGSQAGGTAPATHGAVLDMTGLNNFNCVLSNVFVASDFFMVTSATDTNQTGYARPQGLLLLALTNHITLLDTNFPAYVIGYEPDNNGCSFFVSNCLGQVNFMNFDQMLIGGPKIAFSAAGMYFMPAYNGLPALTDCYAKFRNIDGVSRQTAWAIGDISLSPAVTGSSYGTVNFTRGGVDALVDTIYIGRGGAPSGSTGTTVGTLNFGAGTTQKSIIDVNQIEMGDMLNLTAPGYATVFVYSNATLKVNNYIRLINTVPGTANNTCRAFLYIYGGTVQVAGDILNNALINGGYSIVTINNGGTLDMRPSNAKPPGNISVATLNYGLGTLTNFATLGVSNLVVTPPNAAFVLNRGQALAPGVGAGTVGTLTIGVTNLVVGSTTANLDGSVITNNGNGLVALSLNNGALVMDIGSSSDQINVNGGLILNGTNQVIVNVMAGFGPGSYTLLTYNTDITLLDCNGNPSYGVTGNLATQLVAGGPITNSSYAVTFDNNTPGVIKMNVSLNGSPMALTWVGDGSANVWDIVGANNWNNGSGASKFYQYDSVSFGDTGSATPSINLSGSVYPAAVTFNASKNYTIGGSGQITGLTPLTQSGGGTLTLLVTNSYTGGTTISAGTVKLGDGATSMGSLGSGAVSLGGALAVAVPANQTQSLANSLTGAGLLSVEGPGKVVLSGTNQSYTGKFQVTGGTLVPSALTAISYGWSAANKLIYVTNSGTLDINGLALSNNITLSGAGYTGAGALVNNGAGQANATMQLFMAGDASVGGNYRMDINNVGTVPGGLSGNGYNLTKVGTNCVSLYSLATSVWNNNLQNITVNAGVLRLQYGSLLSANPASTITVANGATFEMNNVWAAAPVNVVATLQNGACLYGTGGTGTNIVGTTTNAQDNLFTGTINLNGTNVLDVSTNSVLVINGVIAGNGNLVKGIGIHPTSATTANSTGVGRLVLGGTNTFTGNLLLPTGVLALTNTGSVSAAANIALQGGVLDASGRADGALTVGANQTLSGLGTVIGNLYVPTNAFLSPGSATGLLTNIGNAILAGTTTMTIAKTNGATSCSTLGVSGGLRLGGTLNATFTGSGLTNGDKFQLFSSAIISSNFTTVSLPSVATWTDNTSVDGSIVVLSVNTEPTNRPSLNWAYSGSSLSLSWPLSYTSYKLQEQTNSIGVGLSTNWITVPTTNNTISISVDTHNPSVFYRLSK